MLRGEFDAAEATDTTDLLRTYGQVLAETIEALGVETVAENASLSPTVVATVRDGDVADLTLADAAAILASDPERPPADVIAAEARDILLMGMTTAVLDVESLASELRGPLDPKEIQQKIEGRHPITLEEFARIHHCLASR